MHTFHCACDAPVFFGSVSCLGCGRDLGFEPDRRALVTLEAADDHSPRTYRVLGEDSARRYRRCENGTRHGVCNWLVDAAHANPLCIACRLNRTIPNLDDPRNARRWAALESAKRRLLWGLLELGVPVPGRSRLGGAVLAFEFLEDARTNPTDYLEHVSTGHLDGVITINVAEADDALREQARTDLDELYRTLLGHFRHESGHYYWGVLIADSPELASFRATFGDERNDYAAALAHYYAQPFRAPGGGDYISAYARSHPLEDWAESWAHYLHMCDAMDTARTYGLTEVSDNDPFEKRLDEWVRVTVMLNELKRSLGSRDAYPFVIGAGAARKLRYIDERVRATRPS